MLLTSRLDRGSRSNLESLAESARTASLATTTCVHLLSALDIRELTLCRFQCIQRCAEMVFAATPPYDGTLTSFYTLPADL